MSTSVLIVDDEYGLADIVADVLRERGFSVRIAINGLQAMELMAEARPDVVLLDVMMPIMPGPEVLLAMRGDPTLAAVPVIMMSALRESIPTDEPSRFQASLVKPFSPDQLFRALSLVLAP